MDFDGLAFLAEPLRPASVATVSPAGRPALATMWFLFADGVFWFHSPGGTSAYLESARANRLVSVMVETFDPIGRVVQVRATGPASVEERDVDRVGQIYDRYLGPNELWNKGWRSQQNDDTYVLWTVEPAAGSAVQFPNLLDAGGVFRWTSTQAFHEALAAASL